MFVSNPFGRYLGAIAFSVPVLLASTTASVAQTLDFFLSNETSVTLFEFYVSPTDVTSWEQDLLGDGVLIPDDGAKVSIRDGRSTCIYDIKGVFADGDEVVDYGIDLCELGAYTFTEK